MCPASLSASPHTLVSPRTPNRILHICPTAGPSRAWMEARLARLPQMLLLLGAAALAASALETGEHEGAWWGAQKKQSYHPSRLFPHDGLGPLDLEEAGKPCAWSCLVPPSPLGGWGSKSPRNRGLVCAHRGGQWTTPWALGSVCVHTPSDITASPLGVCFFSSKAGIRALAP